MSADNKSLQARRLKEQHALEQQKLDAIENKIERARRKIEESKVQKSMRAQRISSSRPQSHFDPPDLELNLRQF